MPRFIAGSVERIIGWSCCAHTSSVRCCGFRMWRGSSLCRRQCAGCLSARLGSCGDGTVASLGIRISIECMDGTRITSDEAFFFYNHRADAGRLGVVVASAGRAGPVVALRLSKLDFVNAESFFFWPSVGGE